MPYLQAHREKAMEDLIAFTMKWEESGAEVKFSLKQLLIFLYANSHIDAKKQEYLKLQNMYQLHWSTNEHLAYLSQVGMCSKNSSWWQMKTQIKFKVWCLPDLQCSMTSNWVNRHKQLYIKQQKQLFPKYLSCAKSWGGKGDKRKLFLIKCVEGKAHHSSRWNTTARTPTNLPQPFLFLLLLGST